MSTELMQEQLVTEQNNIEKKKIGMKRYVTQIIDTISFEIKRTWKTFVLLLIVYFAIFLLNFLIFEIREAQRDELPEETIDYIDNYFGFLGILIIISTATFGGGIIAEDFQKQTGNLLFPKISKNRLLIGRTISRYALNAILIVFYYIMVGIITNYEYEEIPDTYINSMGWALLYTFMVFTFVIFMSSINKSKATAIIISILLFIMVFNILNTILFFTRIEIEPLFIPTYYENIIQASLDMPEPRFEDEEFGRPGQDNPTFKRWITPSIYGALIGMLLFSAVQLTAAYLFYKRRQSKNE